MGPRWLLAGKLAFHHAEAAALHIARKTPPADHSGVPDELHVPWRLRFDNATAATLRYAPTSGAIQTYGDVGFALDFGARAWQLQLHRLQTRWGRLEGDGSIDDGRTRLAMKGNSVAAMLGSADGNLVLAMNGGSMSDLVLRLANLDIANSLIALARGNPAIPIRCLVADFAAEDGVLHPRTMVLDTEHTVIHGEGQINLRTESLALRLVAEPKDGSLFALRGPIRIDGTLGNPGLHPELSGLAARGGAAIALGIVATPLAAILPFMQRGKQQNVDCEPLILDASRFIRDGRPARPVETAAAGRNAPAAQSVAP